MPEPAAKSPDTKSANAPGTFVDPILSFNFRLMIPGVMEARFKECTGLEVTVDAIMYTEGGSAVEHQIPGRVRYGPVKLEYGLTQSVELWNWLSSAMKPPVQRRNVQILMLDADGMTEKVRWTLYNAWPCSWQVKPLDSASSTVAMLSLELRYENLVQQ